MLILERSHYLFEFIDDQGVSLDVVLVEDVSEDLCLRSGVELDELLYEIAVDEVSALYLK